VRQTGAHILLVEDDRDLAAGLVDALEIEGYRAARVSDGKTGLREALSGTYDLVILDAMLPALSGFDLLKELRTRSCKVMVLMLTARGQEMDKVRGLKLGADDYVTKPFSLVELMARIAALLRRRPSAGKPDSLEIGEVKVDFVSREAWVADCRVGLTESEFELLELLAARRGEAVSRADLIGRIWGASQDLEISTRTIDQHIAALRRKLGDHASMPHLIETVYGHGYRLVRKPPSGRKETG
jgi:DNA-binding response OmpR family regulator